MSIDLILGTAGHIDHGKTSLIRALTGVNTDRLPEEKKRGITIELGFAHLEVGKYRLGIVDVPGHEKFVRNMLAGATGMDLALLVVAADDSVKQQTLEHLEILRLLKLPAGVIAITKCDVAQPEWLELVEAEIRELVSDTFLAEAPIVRTSSHTMGGIEELKCQLMKAAENAIASERLQMIDAPFRMALDRTFSIEGHGTVVTGSVASGRAKAGDALMIQPGNISVRVRGIQNHDALVDEVHRGQRAAINLAGIHHDQTRRGQELTASGYLVPAKILTVNLTLLKALKRPLKDRARTRLHVGTAELICSVRLLDKDVLLPGESGFAQLFLSDPAVTIWNQPFVLRSESPVTTIGGGQILDPDARKIRNVDEEVLQQVRYLQSDEASDRAGAAMYFAGLRELKPNDLTRHTGIHDTESIQQQLLEHGTLVEFRLSQSKSQRMHRGLLDRICRQFTVALRKLHEENPLRSLFDRQSFLSGFAWLGENNLLEAILKHMQSEKQVRISDRGVSLVGMGPSLSKNEQSLYAQLMDWFRDADLQTPSIDECVQRANKNKDSVPQLIQMGVNNGELICVAADYHLHLDVVNGIQQKLAESQQLQSGATMAELRDLLGTTRKYSIPLFEYFDASGFTVRDGDTRKLNQQLASQDPILANHSNE